MKTIDYVPQGTCSKQIHIELRNGKISAAFVLGGCNGNLKGICRLIEGMEPEEVIKRFDGIRCGSKSTSCPDQIACALRALLKQDEANVVE